jgi:DNA-3-methyladenine glycosylase II
MWGTVALRYYLCVATKPAPDPLRDAIKHLKKVDPVMAQLIALVGPFRPTLRPATFEAMVRSIVFQQLAGAAARTIFERLRKAAEQVNTPAQANTELGRGTQDRSPYDGGFMVTPDSILALTEEQMRACGLSRQKLSYIRDLAERTRSGDVNFEQMPSMSDEEIIEHLTRVKGIGLWSAQMFLMFALGRMDVMPTVDLGINTAVCKWYRKRKVPKPKQLLKLAEPWRPYRTLACWYLWRSLDQKTP